MDRRKVYVALVQEPMAALDDAGTALQVFDSPRDAMAWVNECLSAYNEGDERDRVNWEVFERYM